MAKYWIYYDFDERNLENYQDHLRKRFSKISNFVYGTGQIEQLEFGKNYLVGVLVLKKNYKKVSIEQWMHSKCLHLVPIHTDTELLGQMCSTNFNDSFVFFEHDSIEKDTPLKKSPGMIDDVKRLLNDVNRIIQTHEMENYSEANYLKDSLRSSTSTTSNITKRISVEPYMMKKSSYEQKQKRMNQVKQDLTGGRSDVAIANDYFDLWCKYRDSFRKYRTLIKKKENKVYY